MGLSQFWGGHTHRCLLVFTSVILLCEIVVGRLCNSLINMVDSFHTLYVLIHIILHPWKISTGASATSIANPYASSESQEPQTRAPTTTPDSSHRPSPHAGPADQAVLESTTFVSEEGPYNVQRIWPFGALISALLLASLSVSITLEILSHMVQPHSVKHPALVTAVGAVSLLFNAGMLIWRGCREKERGADGRIMDLTETQSGLLTTSNDNAIIKGQLGEGANTDVEETGHRGHSSPEGSFPDGTLLFCNPGASSVLSGEQGSTSALSTPNPPKSPSSPPQHEPSCAQNSISHDSTGNHQPQQAAQMTGALGVVATFSGSKCQPVTPVDQISLRQDWCNHMTSRHGEHSGCVQVITTVTRSLLASVLVLLNGLVLLSQNVDCMQHHWTCHLLMYLDPGSSMLAVLVLLVATMPELRRHGLLLLQAVPAHVCLEELVAHVGHVPGVLAVHELHVWQLSETCLVASVHVHCPAGLETLECSKLMMTITEVLSGFGVTHCTVQPEFLPLHSNEPESTATQAQVKVPGVADRSVQTHCILRCGKECEMKMCCSSPEMKTCSTAPPTAGVEMRHQDVIIENTHL